MYCLTENSSFVHLSEDFHKLEFGNQKVRFTAVNPFQFQLVGAARVTENNMVIKKLHSSNSVLQLEFSDFRYAARFPNNEYCRPESRFVPNFRFRVTIELKHGDMIIHTSSIENLGNYHAKLQIAQNFFSGSSNQAAELILPIDYGLKIPFPRRDTFEKTYAPSASWSLPIHGVFNSSGGMGLWCDDFDREYTVSFNTGATPDFGARCSLLFAENSNSPHSMRFILFSPGSDFQQLGFKCRQLRKKSGRFRSFQDKIAANPECSQLPGTVFWKHNVYFKTRPAGVIPSYSLYVSRPDWNETEGLPGNWTAAEIFETAKQNGFDRVLVCNTGWNNLGFDAGYPRRFPINPERGTATEFQQAAQAARQLSPGYTLSVHDNYIDVYDQEEFNEAELLQLIPGVGYRKIFWRGGQSYAICSSCTLKYAQRDLPRIAALSGRGGIYLDVNAAVPLYCCHAIQHPLNRQQDWSNRRELFLLAKKYFGALAVEGCGTDHFADLIDIGAYGGLHFTQLPILDLEPVPVPIPLWQIVYHDSVLNYFGEGYSPVHGSEYRLYQALYTLLPTSFNAHSRKISTELREAQTAPLIEFEDLIPRTVTRAADTSFITHGVSRALYGNGTTVIANFTDETFGWDGLKIPPRDFLITNQ